MKNPINLLKDWSIESKEVFSMIINKMENSMYNKDNSHIVGRQKKLLVSKSTIQEYSFEWIMRLNSTNGRLYILTNWE